MRKKISILILIAGLFFCTLPQTRAGVDVDVNLFFGNLEPYGNWVSVPTYGTVWYPSNISSAWQPYSYGHWIWTDYGWYWVSDEPWGQTYHYGQWVYTADYGWVWVPGTVWQPAWVSWYVGPSYIGWAPLPPYGYGYVNQQPYYCRFVPFHAFLSLNLTSYYAPPAQNITIIRNTTNITNINVINNGGWNQGPNVAFMQQKTRASIQTRTIAPFRRNLLSTQNGSQGNATSQRPIFVTHTQSPIQPAMQRHEMNSPGRQFTAPQNAPARQVQTPNQPGFNSDKRFPRYYNEPRVPQTSEQRPAPPQEYYRPQPQQRPTPPQNDYRPQPQQRPTPPQNDYRPQPQQRPAPPQSHRDNTRDNNHGH